MFRSNLIVLMAAASLLPNFSSADIKCRNTTYIAKKGECPEVLESKTRDKSDSYDETTTKILRLMGKIEYKSKEPGRKDSLFCYYATLQFPQTLDGAKPNVGVVQCESVD